MKRLNSETGSLFKERIGYSYEEYLKINQRDPQVDSRWTTSVKTKHKNEPIPLNSMDRFVLISETKTNLSINTGVAILEKPLTHKQLCERLARLIEKFYQFGSVIKDGMYVPIEVNPSDHVRYVPLKLPKNVSKVHERKILQETCSSFVNVPLDPSRPLWEVIVIDNYSQGYVLFWRIHHCVGDGLSMSYVFAKLCDQRMELPTFKIPHYEHSKIYRVFFAVMFVLWMILGSIRVLFKWICMIFVGPDPRTCFKTGAELGVQKKIAWSSKIQLDDAKQAGRRFKATFNDVMLTCIAGALDAYQKRQTKHSLKRMEIRAAIPINIRMVPEMKELGNEFGFAVTYIPLGISNSIERLKNVKKKMDYVKKLPESFFSYKLQAIVQRIISDKIVKKIWVLLSTYLTFVSTNLRGPSFQLSIGGSVVKEMVGFVPPPHNVGIGFGIVTYNGNVGISVSVDEKLGIDVTALLSDIEEEFERLCELTGTLKK